MKKHLGLIFAILFILFAAVQYNDPDPWIWIIIYGIVAIASFFQWIGKVSDKVLLLFSVVFFAATLSYVPDLMGWAEKGFPNIAGEMKTDNPHIELVRETLGLAIACASLFYLYRISRPKL
ncbi:MAG: hypothetical protein HN488_05085 [Saprospiraceae bacterium]|nr:hypothetical protein [Saprospiraceae bacterium]